MGHEDRKINAHRRRSKVRSVRCCLCVLFSECNNSLASFLLPQIAEPQVVDRRVLTNTSGSLSGVPQSMIGQPPSDLSDPSKSHKAALADINSDDDLDTILQKTYSGMEPEDLIALEALDEKKSMFMKGVSHCN